MLTRRSRLHLACVRVCLPATLLRLVLPHGNESSKLTACLLLSLASRPLSPLQNCIIEDSLLMGADFYEQPTECALLPGCMPVGVGKDTHVSTAAHGWPPRGAGGPSCSALCCPGRAGGGERAPPAEGSPQAARRFARSLRRSPRSHCALPRPALYARLQIRGAIVDKNARIGQNCKIINVDGVQVRERANWVGACMEHAQATGGYSLMGSRAGGTAGRLPGGVY